MGPIPDISAYTAARGYSAIQGLNQQNVEDVDIVELMVDSAGDYMERNFNVVAATLRDFASWVTLGWVDSASTHINKKKSGFIQLAMMLAQSPFQRTREGIQHISCPGMNLFEKDGNAHIRDTKKREAKISNLGIRDIHGASAELMEQIVFDPNPTSCDIEMLKELNQLYLLSEQFKGIELGDYAPETKIDAIRNHFSANPDLVTQWNAIFVEGSDSQKMMKYYDFCQNVSLHAGSQKFGELAQVICYFNTARTIPEEATIF